MKKFLITQILGAALLAPLCTAEMREFKSADGSKTLYAEIAAVDLETGIATLMLYANDRQIYAPVTSFSEEDQAYIKSAGLAMAAGRNLGVRFHDKEKILSEKKNPANGYQTLTLKGGYGLEFKNIGQANFNDLKIEYQIFYKAYLDPFKSRERTKQVTEGSFDIAELASGKEEMVVAAADSVDLTRIKQLPKSECAGGT
jgi:hypothetical protein